MSSVKLQLSSDRSRVSIGLDDPQPEGMDAKSLEGLIRALKAMRAQMLPAVSEDAPLGQKMDAIPDPRWWVEPETFSGGTLFMYRDPGAGWQAIVFPIEAVEKLAELFSRQREALQAAQRGPRN